MNSNLKISQFYMMVLAIAVALLFCANGAFGQSAAFATITGRVLDPRGGAVPNATVTATNTETGLVRKTTVTSDGLYHFENLAPGIWDVTVDVEGFAKEEVKGVKLLVGEQRDVNFNLELAGQKTSVVVSSEVPLIETTKTDTSMVIDDKAVANLPTTTSFNAIGGVANDYQGLAASAPGVKYDYTGNSSDIEGPGNINDRGIQVSIDGGNISDASTSARDALGASVEEVKEFQVLTNNYNAEYGQAGNIILNVITKSGTNSFHGDGHGYFRGRNLGASDFFYNLNAPTSRAPFFKHEEGFTVGGPFVKDRIFWFGSYEKVAQGSPATFTPFGNSVTVSQDTNEILGSAKLDIKLTDKHTLTVRYNLQRDIASNLNVQTGPDTALSGLVNSTVHDNTFNVGLVSTMTPHTVNEARFFWHRTRSLTPTNSTLPGQAGPNFYIGADFCCPQGFLQSRFQYIDNVSYTHGTHTIKSGVNISHFPYDQLFQQYHFGEYGGFANGLPTRFTIGFGNAQVVAADTIYGLFVQDTWQMRRNLTLNYGLRYDFESGAFKGGTLPNASVPGGCTQANGIIPACGSDKNNFQPRLGIAWSPNFESGFLHTLFGDPGKTVIRAAGAEVTELAYLNIVLDSLNFDGVNLLTQTITASSVGNDGTTSGQTILNAFPNSPDPVTLQLFKPINFFGRIRPISPTLKNPEIREASLSITRQVGPSFVYSIGFQGVYGFGLFGETDTNLAKPVADPAHPGFFYLPNDPDPRFKAIRTQFNNRNSAYSGLVLTAQKRLSHHVQFQGSYTWSKTLASGEDFFGLSEPANPFISTSSERALSQQDIRHLANFNVVLDTSNLVSTPFVKTVVNNWTFGLLSTLQSGRPYPVSTGDGPSATTIFPALGNETAQRPNVLPNGTLVSTNIGSASGTNLAISPNGVAACQAFQPASVCPAATTFLAPAGANPAGPVDSYTGDPVDFQFFSGNLVRNAGQSLPLYRFDVSVKKAFKIPKWESAALELKMDVFNVFNHPLFILNNGNDNLAVIPINQPTVTKNGITVANPNFVCTAGCIDPNTGFYLGADGRALNLKDFQRATHSAGLNFNGLGAPAATVTPRIIQLAIRFIW
jgi:Carboxypeptidase regulatory-like domain/TonB dependent receptor